MLTTIESGVCGVSDGTKPLQLSAIYIFQTVKFTRGTPKASFASLQVKTSFPSDFQVEDQ